MEEFLNKLVGIGVEYGSRLLISLVVLIIGSRLIKILDRSLKKERKFSRIDKEVKEFLIGFINIALKVLLFITILSVLGIPMTSLITILGSAAVAIGLALQGGLSNLAGGLMLLIFKPFKDGDFIEAEGQSGTVDSISLFYTTIITVDNRVVHLPNGGLSNSVVVNYTANEKRMLNVDISVSYDSNIDKVKKVITDTLNSIDKVIKDEPMLIKLKTHNASSLDFVVRAWVNTPDYWDVYYEFMENVKNNFDKNKIEIPYQQLDVHVK